LLEKGESFICDLEQRGKLYSYFFIVCSNLQISQNKGVKIVESIEVSQNIFEGEYEEINIDFEALEKDYWYKATVLKKYLEIGTIKKLSALTEIPYITLQQTISQTKQIILNNGEKYIKRINR
jgi:hypothetical protein